MYEKKTMEERWDDFKFAAKQKWIHFSNWCGQNKEMVIAVTPVLVSGTIELVKVVIRNKATSEERKLKDNYIYDRSSGHYYETRRKPKSSEWREIDYRHKILDQPLGEVLNDMRLLK